MGMRFPAALVHCVLSLLAGCGGAGTHVGVDPGDAQTADAQPHSMRDAEDGGDGGALWSWSYRWVGTENCAMYGDDARVHLRIGVLDGGTVDPPRLLDAPCTAGELLVELPSRLVNHTMFTIESAATGEKSRLQVVSQDVHMARNMYFSIWPRR